MNFVREYLPGLLFLVGVAIFAQQIAFLTGVNHLILAVLLGLIIINVFQDIPGLFRRGTSTYKLWLEAGIVLLGARIVLQQLFEVGVQLLLIVIGMMLFAILIVLLISSYLFQMDTKLGTLLASGLGICGVSAIVAVAGSIKAKNSHVAYAVAAVLLFDVITIFLYPIIGSALNLSDMVFGIWAGVTMFSTGPVTAAGFAYSDQAGQWATLTKLTRNMFIGVIAIGFAIIYSARGIDAAKIDSKSKYVWDQFPKFVLGFILFMVLASMGLFSGETQESLRNAYNWLFTIAFVGLGLNIHLAELRRTGLQPVIALLMGLTILSIVSLVIISLTFG